VCSQCMSRKAIPTVGMCLECITPTIRPSFYQELATRKRPKVWALRRAPKRPMEERETPYRTVYCLSALGWPFYVGSTVKSLEERLKGHIDAARSEGRVRKSSSASVIRALMARGLLNELTIYPLTVLPLTVSVRELRLVELECIRLLSDSGLHLFQIVGTTS
jgi:hypothetical protein